MCSRLAAALSSRSLSLSATRMGLGSGLSFGPRLAAISATRASHAARLSGSWQIWAMTGFRANSPKTLTTSKPNPE